MCIKNIFKKLFKKNNIISDNSSPYEIEILHHDEHTGEVIIKGKIIETYPVEYWFPEDLNENENKTKMKDLDKLNDPCYENIKKYLQEMKPFTDYIPSVPKMETPEDFEEYVIKNYIRCGAIPKKDLIIGRTYIGDCRNADEAIWNGKVFIYKRTKFGLTFDEEINHFEDDNGYDLFVPIKLKDNL